MVYFDLDGVLCDFDNEYDRLVGVRWDASFPGMSKSAAVQALTKEEKDEKWSKIAVHQNFFINLPWMQGAKDMLLEIRDKVGAESIGILSAASHHMPQSREHKHQWLERETPWILPANRVIVDQKRDKAQYALSHWGYWHPNVLVDDYTTNTEAWVAAGGLAVLYENAEQAKLEILKHIKDTDYLY